MNIRKRYPIVLAIALGAGVVVAPLIRADDAKPDPLAVKSPEETVMRVYDIRSLVRPVQDFPLETSPHGPSFVAPANRPEAANESAGVQGSGGSGGGQGLFENASHKADPPAPSEAAAMDALVRTIESSVASDTWRDAGGTLGSITQMQGRLVVTQTPASQRQIETLLHQLGGQRGPTLRTTAEWLLLPSAEVSKLLKKHEPGDKARAALRKVDPEALDKLPTTIRRFHAELLSQNGQVVHYVSGHERTETVNVTPTVGSDVSALTPIVQNLGAGIALQVNPLADLDQHKAIVTIFSTYTDPDKPGHPTANEAAKQKPPENPGAQKEADRADRINTILPAGDENHSQPAPAPATQSAGSASDVSAAYRHQSGIVQELRTTVRLPLGVPVMVGTMTLEPVVENVDGQELVLILTVQVAE